MTQFIASQPPAAEEKVYFYTEQCGDKVRLVAQKGDHKQYLLLINLDGSFSRYILSPHHSSLMGLALTAEGRLLEYTLPVGKQPT